MKFLAVFVLTAALAVLTVAGTAGVVWATELPYTTPSINGDITTMQGAPGIYSWTDATSAVGTWSAKLYWPGSGGYAQARVFPAPAGVSTVSSVTSWSYWAKAPLNYVPNLSFVLDDPDISNNGPMYSGLGYDTVVTVWPTNYGSLADTWQQILSGASLPYTVWTNAYSGGPIMKTMTWSEFKNPWSQWGNNFDFSNATVLRMNIGKGVIGTNTTITAYADDFVLNNHTYSFEPYLEAENAAVPEPLTMAGLFLGLAGVGGYIRNRRRA